VKNDATSRTKTKKSRFYWARRKRFAKPGFVIDLQFIASFTIVHVNVCNLTF
jgi:hypothetical protein